MFVSSCVQCNILVSYFVFCSLQWWKRFHGRCLVNFLTLTGSRSLKRSSESLKPRERSSIPSVERGLDFVADPSHIRCGCGKLVRRPFRFQDGLPTRSSGDMRNCGGLLLVRTPPYDSTGKWYFCVRSITSLNGPIAERNCQASVSHSLRFVHSAAPLPRSSVIPLIGSSTPHCFV